MVSGLFFGTLGRFLPLGGGHVKGALVPVLVWGGAVMLARFGSQLVCSCMGCVCVCAAAPVVDVNSRMCTAAHVCGQQHKRDPAFLCTASAQLASSCLLSGLAKVVL